VPDCGIEQIGSQYLVTLRERPDLCGAVDRLVRNNLPPFMTWGSPGNWRWHRLYKWFPQLQVAAVSRDGAVIGAVNGVPVDWRPGRAELPSGYDSVLVGAAAAERSLPCLCLLSVSVAPNHRRQGVAQLLIRSALRRASREGGVVIIPLRPTGKADHPLIPIERYAECVDEWGRARDPWIRTHLRLGARVLGFAPRSLVVRAPLDRWRECPGFIWIAQDRFLVDGALNPIRLVEPQVAEYAEPNVWIGYEPEHVPKQESCEAS
jgi:GNAT superfamily N-acetyltransferase